MSFYSLPNEIHLAIIDLTCPVPGSHYKHDWRSITLVCRLWRKLSQKKYVDNCADWMGNGHLSISINDLNSFLDQSHSNNPELWGTRDKFYCRIESVDELRQIWKWLATTSDWNSWVKKICIGTSAGSQLYLPGTLSDLPVVNLEGVSFRTGQTFTNSSMVQLLRTLPNLKQIVRPVLIEANTYEASGDSERRENYSSTQILPERATGGKVTSQLTVVKWIDACLFVQQLATSNITVLDLTYRRTYYPPQKGTDRPAEPVFPLLPDSENPSEFFRALVQLSHQLKVFIYRGRGSDDMFRACNIRGTWNKLEYMMIEFDVLDANGFYWVDFEEDSDSDAESESSSYYEDPISDESSSDDSNYFYNHFEGLDEYDPTLNYTPRRERWDSLFENVARTLEHMPKIALLVVGINPDIISIGGRLIDSALDWELCGLAFAPATPKALRLDQVPRLGRPLWLPHRSNDEDSTLELRIAHTERYSPSDATVGYLRGVFGDVGIEKCDGFKSLAMPTIAHWKIC